MSGISGARRHRFLDGVSGDPWSGVRLNRKERQMRVSILAFFAAAYGLPAMAHVGHLGELAGHDHWVAGAAIGVAAAITLWAGLKGRKSKKDESSNEAEDKADAQDAEGEA